MSEWVTDSKPDFLTALACSSQKLFGGWRWRAGRGSEM